MTNRISVRLFLALILVTPLFAADPPHRAIQFTNVANLTALGRGEVVDLNSDGLLDLVSSEGIRFYWNHGTTFVTGVATNFNELDDYPVPLEAGDFDNDSDVDLFFARRARYFSDGMVRPSFHATVLWNSNNVAFTNPLASAFLPVRCGAAGAADFDNDGDLDLVLSGFTNSGSGNLTQSATRLYENFGDAFALHPMPLHRFEKSTVSWADYDSDGDSDLFLSGSTNDSTAGRSILYRNDHGQLNESGLQLPPLLRGTIAWGDFDNDADLDLVMAGASNAVSSTSFFASVYRNDGDTFTSIPLTDSSFGSSLSVQWVDLDADGDLDIILAVPYVYNARLYTNNGDGTFAAPVSLNFISGETLIADFDNDGRPDLTGSALDERLTIHRNITAHTNTPPAAPTNLIAAVESGSVTFSWNRAHDAEQTNGLTYNLRIGTAPGRGDILSAMANATNGHRFLARLGNTGLRTNWTIHKFRLGNYYWSVQAIDHALATSTFAPEQSFTISNAPPVIETLYATNTTPTSAVIGVRLNSNFDVGGYYLEFSSSNHTGTAVHRELAAFAVDQTYNLLLGDLNPSTRYEVRLVASNGFGVSYSSPRVFFTSPPSALTELPAPFRSFTHNPTFLTVDLDQDGDLDIVNSGNTDLIREHRYFRNDSGIFVEEWMSFRWFPATRPGSPLAITAAGDFNNDSYMDLIFANDNSAITVTYSLDRGTFNEAAVINSARAQQIFPGDSDNDGDLDVLSVGATPIHTVRLNINDNIDPFRYLPIPFAQLQRGGVAEWGDYDSDGDHDYLLFGSTNEFSLDPRLGHTRIFRNDGGNIFTDAQADLPGTLYSAAWADYDNDRDLDVAIITQTNQSSAIRQFQLHRNDGTNGFHQVELMFAGGDSLASIHWIDFNRDGRIDLLLRRDPGSSDHLHLFLNGGNDQFVEQNLGLPTGFHFQTALADFDGDHLPDILLNTTTNYSQWRLRLFRNNLVSTNPLPPVPTNLTAVVARSSATLSWQLPESASTNGIAYTYNLRVSTNRLWDFATTTIMSHLSHRTTGALQLPQRGNAGQCGTWTLRDLPPGTYYWSVQSVDHAFNASPLAFSASPLLAEGSFTIAPEERPLQILSASTTGINRDHRLTLDGPTRSRAEMHHSADLNLWSTNSGYIYIGGEPTTFSTGHNNTRFYRFRLLE